LELNFVADPLIRNPDSEKFKKKNIGRQKMKRKRELMEESDNDDIGVHHVPNIKVSDIKQPTSKLKKLLTVNLALFTFLVIPFLAFTAFSNHFESFDRIIGERCNSKFWSPKNLSLLQTSLEDNLFGQHIAKAVIMSTLSKRWQGKIHYNKPLVMSFHGWTGGGKNYASKFIAESLFRKGLHSRYVRTFISTVHFYHEAKVEEYKENLRKWILGNVTQCPDSIFLFDEVDKLPESVLDSLKPFLDHHAIINGVEMNRSTFILLSNTGGREITSKTLDHWQGGKIRSELRYADFEQLVLKGAFNEGGGLHKSAIIDKSLIDAYVPFLPLEQVHVKQCARRELLHRELEPNDYSDLINQVVEELSFWPDEVRLFSTTGCKRVSQKVDELLYEYGL